VSISGSGVAANDPNRQQGSWNQTIGSGKETIGNALGMEGMKREGAQQNAQGKGQEASGQISDLGSGISDRVGGTVGGAVASLTGDREEQQKRQAQHDTGKVSIQHPNLVGSEIEFVLTLLQTLQRGAESDINKQ